MKKLSNWLKVIFALLILYVVFLQPIPFYIEKPGGAFGLDAMVEIDDKFSDKAGDFYITTVGIQQATPFTALSSILPFRDLRNEKELFGEIEDFEEYDTIQQFYMDSSINTAIQVAFEAADRSYELNYEGVYVLQVVEESDFKNTLQVGDTVTSVDGRTFQSSYEFIDYVSTKEVGDEVTVEFKRDEQLKETSGELILLDTGVPGLGIGLVDRSTISTQPPITIHAGAIGGPSAGLMFSLQVYNQLLDGNLRDDYKIAGTGSLSPDGTVGRIGGIEKKVVAADKEGAAYFFAPDDEVTDELKAVYPKARSNYEEAVDAAQGIKTDMEIIPVKTFSDAIEFLEELEKEEAASTAYIPIQKLFNPYLPRLENENLVAVGNVF